MPIISGTLTGKDSERHAWSVSFELDYSGDRTLETNVDFPIPLPDKEYLIVTPHIVGPQENGRVSVTLFAIHGWFTLSADDAITQLLSAGARNVRKCPVDDA